MLQPQSVANLVDKRGVAVASGRETVPRRQRVQPNVAGLVGGVRSVGKGLLIDRRYRPSEAQRSMCRGIVCGFHKSDVGYCGPACQSRANRVLCHIRKSGNAAQRSPVHTRCIFADGCRPEACGVRKAVGQFNGLNTGANPLRTSKQGIDTEIAGDQSACSLHSFAPRNRLTEK